LYRFNPNDCLPDQALFCTDQAREFTKMKIDTAPETLNDELRALEAIDVQTIKNDFENLDQDDPLRKAVLDGSSLEAYALQNASELAILEQQSIEDYLQAVEPVAQLHQEITICDKILGRMEDMLGNFQSDLLGLIDEISALQTQSADIALKLKNRQVVNEILTAYIDGVVVSPGLIKRICEGPIDGQFVADLKELNTKLEHVRSGGGAARPCISEVAPELEKLKTKAVQRIKDFLLEKINSLKRPQTNIQIIQQSVLVEFQALNVFLAQHHPIVEQEIRTLYAHTMSRVYVAQFRTYLSSLARLKLQDTATSRDVIVPPVESTAVESAYARMTTAMGITTPKISFKDRGNIFALCDRDTILQNLDQEPMVCHTHQNEKYHEEVIFRSEQRLLLDTATAEFLFLGDFFCVDDAQQVALFHEVFGKTLTLFRESLDLHLSVSFDAVGFLLMIHIVEHLKQSCERRRIESCLSQYFDHLLVLLWPRLKSVLDANLDSLKNAHPSMMGITSTQPHICSRRFAEFVASLSILRYNHGTQGTLLTTALSQLQAHFEHLLSHMAKQVDSRNDMTQLVFLINNLYLILTIFHEKQVGSEVPQQFEEVLQHNITSYVEKQLVLTFGDLIRFVKVTEQDIAANPGDSNAIDANKMGRLVTLFAQSWQSQLEGIEAQCLTHFSDMNNGQDIFRQIQTQLLLYYTRFNKLVPKAYPPGGPPAPFARELVPNSTILQHIKDRQ
jgi:hypothetical protein